MLWAGLVSHPYLSNKADHTGLTGEIPHRGIPEGSLKRHLAAIAIVFDLVRCSRIVAAKIPNCENEYRRCFSILR